MDRIILLTGFGAFGSVRQNPSQKLALALDGCFLQRLRMVGREIPVRYGEGPQETLA